MAFERYLKRDCGCEHEIVHKDSGYKVYLSVCKEHLQDWEFRNAVNALGERFDRGLNGNRPDVRG